MNSSKEKTIVYDKLVIDSSTINELIKYHQSCIRRKEDIPDELNLIFGANIAFIDEVLYSYIFNFRLDFPKTKIFINFEVARDEYWTAIQYVNFCNLQLKDNPISIYREGVKDASYLPHSTKIIFPILLDKNKLRKNNKSLFNNYTWKIQEFKDLPEDQKNDIQKLYNNKNEFYKYYVNTIIKHNKYFTHYLDRYFINLLSDLNLLRYYFNEKRYLVSKFNKRLSIKYIRETSMLLEKYNLFNKPKIEIMLISILVSNEAGKKLNTIEDLNNQLSWLEDLLKLVDNICVGIEELVKNVVEHTHNQSGVFTARVVNKTKFTNLFSELHKKHFEQNKDSYESWGESFLSVSVIDSGTKGIPESYIEKLEEFKHQLDKTGNQYSKSIEEDVTSLRKIQNSVYHFFDYKKVSLNHQIHRSNARIGLLLFSKVICEDRNGIITYSTNINNGTTSGTYPYRDNDLRWFEGGTNINFILPILKSKDKDHENLSTPPSTEGTSVSVLKELFNYRIINPNDTIESNHSSYNHIYTNINLIQKDSSKEKYGKILSLCDSLKRINFIEGSIILIDASELSTVLINSSDWLRFLANVQNEVENPIIIKDFDLEVFKEIILICQIFDKGIVSDNENSLFKFWNDKSNLLFYIKDKYEVNLSRNGDKKKHPFWYSALLTGKSYEDYLSINADICRYQHNIVSITENYERKKSDDYIRSSLNGPFFIGGMGVIPNFEMIIKSRDGKSLFEETIRSILEIEINSQFYSSTPSYDIRDSYYRSFVGYKISNSHFRLGSKIHIDDFFYAKRLFYNSFYANRFAYIVARYLIENNYFKDINNLTIIGYSKYSELLVSNIRRLIEYYLKTNKKNDITSKSDSYLKINHDIITAEGNILKTAHKISNNIILVIPISSTFSTSDKLKNELNRIIKSVNKTNENITPINYINSTDISVLMVGDKETYVNFENLNESNEKWKMYRAFSWDCWNKSDSKLLHRTKQQKASEYPQKLNYQKYFIDLTTNWHYIETCRLCFPNKCIDEVCLLETGLNSVTPEVIFDLPASRKEVVDSNWTSRFYTISEDKNKESSVISLGKTIKSSVISNLIIKGGNRYKLYLRSGQYLKDNEKGVLKWFEGLKQVKNHSSQGIIIITPSKTSNSGFVNMVNELLFNDTATILQYSSKDDLMQNFISFHRNVFTNSRIIYVEDVLFTASDIFRIINYLKSIPSKISPIGVHTCVCLINRMDYWAEQNLRKSLRENGEILSFEHVNAPPINQTNFLSPSLLKENSYKILSNLSATDMMRMHFRELYIKSMAIDLDKKNGLNHGHNPYESILKLAVLNTIYSFFYIKNSGIYDKYKNDILAKDLIPNLEEYILNNKVITGYIEKFYHIQDENKIKEEALTLLYYFCSRPPLSYYKSIRIGVFNKLKRKLITYISRIDNEIDLDKMFIIPKHGIGTTLTLFDNNIGEIKLYSDFQTFRFYMKLGIGLNMNYLISKEFIRAICKLLDWMEKHPDKSQGKSHFGLSTYYIGIVQQLIYQDEAKAIKLVENVKKVLVEEKNSLRNEFSKPSINMLRMLVLENTFIFDSFFSKLSSDNLKFGSFNIEQVDKLLSETQQTVKLDALESMCFDFDQNSIDEELFIALKKTIAVKLMLKNEIHNGSGNSDMSIDKKIQALLKYLCDILDISDKQDKCQGGAFFTVRYKEPYHNQTQPSDLYKISEYASIENDNIRSEVIDNKSIVYNMYKGIYELGSKKPKSFLEIRYNCENDCYESDRISDKSNNLESILDINNFIETRRQQHYQNLFFWRIASFDKNEENIDEDKWKRPIPRAVICFYRCNLNENEKHEYCTKGYYKKNKNEFANNYNGTCSLRRIDPKRLRFLMLLRDDILQFIDYHLDNDSLRAYVEMNKRAQMFGNVEHSTDMYIKNMENAIKQIKDKSQENRMYKALFLIKSRQKLQKIYAASLDNDKNSFIDLLKSYGIAESSFTSKELFDLFTLFIEDLHRDSRKISKYKLNVVNNTSEEIIIQSFDGIMEEILFEVAYNIESHSMNVKSAKKKNIEDLNIEFEIIKGEQAYLSILNNLGKHGDKEKAEDTFNRNNSSHGLSIINKYSKNITNSSISVDCSKQKENKEIHFKILVPINLISNE